MNKIYNPEEISLEITQLYNNNNTIIMTKKLTIYIQITIIINENIKGQKFDT